MDNDRLVRRTLAAYVNTTTGPPPGSLLDDCDVKDFEELAKMALEEDKSRWDMFVKNL